MLEFVYEYERVLGLEAHTNAPTELRRVFEEGQSSARVPEINGQRNKTYREESYHGCDIRCQCQKDTFYLPSTSAAVSIAVLTGFCETTRQVIQK